MNSVLDLEHMLQMIMSSGGRAALILGYMPRIEAGSSSPELYAGREQEVDASIAELVNSGVHTFFFTCWGRFERFFIERLRELKDPHKRQAILVGVRRYICEDSDPSSHFEKIFWTDDYAIERQDIVDALASYCGTLAHYDKEGMSYVKDVVALAAGEQKRIIDMANFYGL